MSLLSRLTAHITPSNTFTLATRCYTQASFPNVFKAVLAVTAAISTIPRSLKGLWNMDFRIVYDPIGLATDLVLDPAIHVADRVTRTIFNKFKVAVFPGVPHIPELPHGPKTGDPLQKLSTQPECLMNQNCAEVTAKRSNDPGSFIVPFTILVAATALTAYLYKLNTAPKEGAETTEKAAPADNLLKRSK